MSAAPAVSSRTAKRSKSPTFAPVFGSLVGVDEPCTVTTVLASTAVLPVRVT